MDIKYRFFCQVCNEYVNVYNIQLFSDGPLAQCPNHEVWTDTKKELFTGLKDKNGIEIYKGDIVIGFNGEIIALISWSNDDAAFCTESLSGAGAMINTLYMLNFEVIGNINQNKDLLK